MPGFKLTWFFEDSNGNKMTEILPATQEDWELKDPTPKHGQSLLLADIVQMARQLRMQKMLREDILDFAIHKKISEIKLYDQAGICSMGQVQLQSQNKVFSKLDLLVSRNGTSKEPPTQEDFETGYELFYAVVFCPTMPIKFFRLIDKLLSSESSRTLIQTIVNILLSTSIPDEMTFNLAKEFYFEMASTLNMTYGNVLRATSLQSANRSDQQIFASNDLNGCQQDSCFENMQNTFQSRGISV